MFLCSALIFTATQCSKLSAVNKDWKLEGEVREYIGLACLGNSPFCALAIRIYDSTTTTKMMSEFETTWL